MRIELTINEDKTVNVFARRTLQKEGPSRATFGVQPEDVPAVTAKLVAELRGESLAEEAVLSP